MERKLLAKAVLPGNWAASHTGFIDLTLSRNRGGTRRRIDRFLDNGKGVTWIAWREGIIMERIDNMKPK